MMANGRLSAHERRRRTHFAMSGSLTETCLCGILVVHRGTRCYARSSSWRTLASFCSFGEPPASQRCWPLDWQSIGSCCCQCALYRMLRAGPPSRTPLEEDIVQRRAPRCTDRRDRGRRHQKARSATAYIARPDDRPPLTHKLTSEPFQHRKNTHRTDIDHPHLRR